MRRLLSPLYPRRLAEARSTATFGTIRATRLAWPRSECILRMGERCCRPQPRTPVAGTSLIGAVPASSSSGLGKPLIGRRSSTRQFRGVVAQPVVTSSSHRRTVPRVPTWTSGQSSVDYSYSFTLNAETLVDGYSIPSGKTFAVMNGVTTSHTATNVRSQIWQRLVCTHGIFWKTDPSNPSVFVNSATNYYNTISTKVDYMGPPSSGGTIWTVNPSESHTLSYTSGYKFGLRTELGVDVSASIEGVGFGTKLASFVYDQQITGSRTMSITVTNTDTVTHTYMWYFEGQNIVHFWQLS